MRMLGTTVFTVVLGLILSLSTARAEEKEEKIALDQVPKAMTDAVKAGFAGAEIKETAKEEEDGNTFFEVSLTHNKQNIDVLSSPDGEIVEIERQIAAGDLPGPVAAGVKAKYPKTTIEKAEEKTVETEVSYEVIIDTGNKTKRKIALDRQGKILEDEEAEG